MIMPVMGTAGSAIIPARRLRVYSPSPDIVVPTPGVPIMEGTYRGNYLQSPIANVAAHEANLGYTLDFVNAGVVPASAATMVSTATSVMNVFGAFAGSKIIHLSFATNWSGSLAQVAAGTHDAAINASADVFLSYSFPRMIVKINQEFNGNGQFNLNWWMGNNSTAWNTWIDAHRKIVTLFRARAVAAGKPGFFEFDWCPVGGQNIGQSPTDAWPGDEYVDYVGGDFYANSLDDDPAAGGPGGANRVKGLDGFQKRTANTLGGRTAGVLSDGLNAINGGYDRWSLLRQRNWAIAHNKMRSIGEFGCGTRTDGYGTGDDPDWMQAILQWTHAESINYPENRFVMRGVWDWPASDFQCEFSLPTLGDPAFVKPNTRARFVAYRGITRGV